jgi:TrmH family RNA methyltransferase
MIKARPRVQGKAKKAVVSRAPVTGAARPSAPAPAIILVQPQLGENIGFAARAMANFGLADLRLVAPRDGWPNHKAHAAAAGAASVADTASLFPTVEQAVGDLHFVFATTARPRDMVKRVATPESAARELALRSAKGERTGVLFGPERSGLDNEALALTDAIITAPVNPGFASLSLPQAVLLFGYEWLKGESATPCTVLTYGGNSTEVQTIPPSREMASECVGEAITRSPSASREKKLRCASAGLPRQLRPWSRLA